MDAARATDWPAELEKCLGSIPMRRSDERRDDFPQTKMEDHKSLPKVAECSSMGKEHLTLPGSVSGDAENLL